MGGRLAYQSGGMERGAVPEVSMKTPKIITTVVLTAVLVSGIGYALGEYGFALALIWPLAVEK